MPSESVYNLFYQVQHAELIVELMKISEKKKTSKTK